MLRNYEHYDEGEVSRYFRCFKKVALATLRKFATRCMSFGRKELRNIRVGVRSNSDRMYTIRSIESEPKAC